MSKDSKGVITHKKFRDIAVATPDFDRPAYELKQALRLVDAVRKNDLELASLIVAESKEKLVLKLVDT